MAKSVDDLIDFLLEEIALSGSRGASINELSSHVRSFYNGHDDSRNDTTTPTIVVSVDRALLSKVWTWLGRHPDVAIGNNKKYNQKSLQEVELEHPGFLDQLSTDPGPNVEVNHNLSGPNGVPLAKTSEAPDNKKHLPRPKEGPRVTVNYERMYRAICGHPPDASKIVPLEFVLLSHIAAARSVGILQGPLTRASGQDKRSVPKRTEALHKKGYIVKETVYAHGNRTSRLTLRRLAAPTTNRESLLSSSTSTDPQRQSTVRGVVWRIFEALSKQNLIPQTDLAERLEMSSTTKSAILAKVIRRLERLRLVKRVKTAFGPSATVEDLKQCIQLVQIPGPGNLEEFDTDELALGSSLVELASIMSIDEPLEPMVSDSNESDRGLSASSSSKAFAQWNPNRLMPNMLREAVQLAGVKGLTNVGARKATTGIFIRRVAEASLFRISCRSLLVQPSHLRHLAVVRVYVSINGVAQFFHYSWDSFRELAKDKDFDIAQVPGAKKALASFNDVTDERVETSTSIGIDPTGVSTREPPSLQMMLGEVDYAHIIKSMGIDDIVSRVGEPTIVETEPGKFSLVSQTTTTRMRNTRAPKKEKKEATPIKANPKQANPKVQMDLPEQELVLGRPRKYMRGTESFWRRQFQQAILDASAGRGARSSQTHLAGMMKHPVGLALYARRPTEFDATLLKAIEAHLPVPAQAQDINEQWVQATQIVLDRCSDGVYLTPKGLLAGSKIRKSQILVFKSSKLKGVKFAGIGIGYPVRFLSSSASHSSVYLGFDPALNGSRAQQDPKETEPRVTRRRKNTGQEPGPRKGVSFEEDRISVSNPRPSLVTQDLDKDFGRDCDETMDENNMQVVQVRPQMKRTRAVRKSKFPAAENEHDDQADPPSQQILPPGFPVSTITTPPRARPSRKRKLTGKAKENAESAMGAVSGSDAGELRLLPMEHELLPTEPVELRAETLIPVATSFPVTASSHDESQQLAMIRVSNTVAESQPIANISAQPNAPVPRIVLGQTPVAGVGVGELLPMITDSPAMPLNHAERQPFISTAISNTVVENNSTTDPLTEPNVPISDSTGHNDMALQKVFSVEGQPTETNQSHSLEPRDSSASEIEPLVTRRLAPKKRRRKETSELEDTDYVEDEHSPRKRMKEGKPRYTAGSNSFCKKLVLHLMSTTKGAAPNDGFTLRRVAAPRWKEEGFGDSFLLKAIKQAVKRLCHSGKLKQTSFSFRGKSGLMARRSILYLPTLHSDSDWVLNVKQKIIEAEPADYIPPEWTDDAALLPLFIAMPRVSRIVGTGPRRRRLSTPESDVLQEAQEEQEASPARSSESPEPQAPPGAATGFITLKIDLLGTLPSVHLENWQSELGSVRKQAERASFAQRRERSSRSQGLHSKDRPLMWANKAIQDFPTSLQDIILVTPTQSLYASAEFVDRNWHRFAREIEAVEAWEQNRSSAAQNSRTSYAFINHSIPAALLLDALKPSKIEFSNLIHFNQSGAQTEIPFPPATSSPQLVSALAEKDAEKMALIAVGSRETLCAPPVLSDKDEARPTRGKRKRKAGDDDVEFRPVARRRKRGPSTRQAKATPTISNIGRKRFIRGVQYLRDLPVQQLQHLTVAVVVVRTLLGGLEGFIDWPIVMTLFPDEPESVIRGRWKTLSTKYRGDIRGLTESLQEKYLDALDADQVPCVSFADPKATDWQGIVAWATDNLAKLEVDSVDDLPADKTSLLDANDFSFVELKSVPSLLVYASNISTQTKESTYSATVFGSVAPSLPAATQPGLNLEFKPRYEVENSDSSFRLARSWVFASILTPDPGFNQDVVRLKLARLGSTEAATDDLLYRAIKVLQEEKLVQKASHKQKSTFNLSRGMWEPAKKLYERFEERRMITAAMLRQAVTYKLDVLDAAFERGESVSIPKDSIIDDGNMVAIINLMSMGQVKPRVGADVPRTRYGLDWEQVGYVSRNMDKSCVEFATNVVQMAGYIFGDTNHIGRNTPVPRGHADEAMGHIPPWLDIHGRFQPKLWEMFVAGTLGLVVQSPGIGARDMSRTMGFALDEDEVALVMEWCVAAGFATMTEPRSRGGGYETTTDWWLCVSRGSWPWVVESSAGLDVIDPSLWSSGGGGGGAE